MSTNLTLGPRDKLLPCPFCGGTVLALCNTWTASYWVECPCGAEVRSYVPGLETSTSSKRAHERAKRSAIRNWNTRDGKAP